MTESPARFPYGATLITPASIAAVYKGPGARSPGSGAPPSWPPAYIPHPVCGGRAPSEELRGPPCEARTNTPLALRICCSALVASDMRISYPTANKEDLDLDCAQRPAVPQAATCRYGLGPTPLRSPAIPHHTLSHGGRAPFLAAGTCYHPRASGYRLQGLEHFPQALPSVQRTGGLARRLFQGRTAPQTTDVIKSDFVIASPDCFDRTDQVHLRPRRGLRHLPIELCQDDGFSRVSRDDNYHAPPPRPAWPRAKEEPRGHALDGNLYGNVIFAFQGCRGSLRPNSFPDRRRARDRRPSRACSPAPRSGPMTALQILVHAGQPRAQLGRGRESFFKELVEIARKVMAEAVRSRDSATREGEDRRMTRPYRWR